VPHGRLVPNFGLAGGADYCSVIDIPETRYATTVDDEQIAYQVWGDGPVDLVIVPTASVPIDMAWEDPRLRSLMERFGTFSRSISLDRRGWGSSDSITAEMAPSLDSWLDDIAGVMTAAASNRAALLGVGDTGAAAMLYAATYPERVSALILFNAFARFIQGPDYPCGLPAEMSERYIDAVRATWGTAAQVEINAPRMVSNDQWCRWFTRAQRLGGSPAAAARFFRATTDTTVHHVLASIQVPTLILHRRENRVARVEHGRYLAEHIPGAAYRELDGDDHLFFTGDTDTVGDEIEEFLTGVRPALATDRVLATVLFTDIVGSSQRAAELGDRAWRKLLDAHDAVVRTQLERFRGREVKTTGDGFLATFDGPARAIHCAVELIAGLRSLGLDIRAGLHTGEVEARGDDIGGIAVHTGARVSGLAEAGEVLVSSTVKDLVAGSGIGFEDRGEHELRGVPGTWKLFSVMM
jgi:class 3 adenylate cyclase